MVRVLKRPTQVSNIDELAARRGSAKAPTIVALSDTLTVGVKLKNISTMFALGLLPEPLMEAAMAIGRKSNDQRTVVDVKESAALQDTVCAAIIAEPPYATLEEIAENGNESVPGKLDLGMMSDDEIGGVFHMVYKGIDSWELFREKSERSDVVESRDGDGETAE